MSACRTVPFAPSGQMRGGSNPGEGIGAIAGATMVGRSAEGALAAVGLIPLMEMTAGAREMRIALVDGPVAPDHPDLATENIRSLLAAAGGTTSREGAAVVHGTYVAGILAARRGSAAPAICPGCTFLVRPIFLETAPDNAEMPSATPDEVADAVAE